VAEARMKMRSSGVMTRPTPRLLPVSIPWRRRQAFRERGCIIGALLFGQLSEMIGRRRSIMLALVMSLLSIPAWAFGHSILILVIGSFFMQAGVQGAFGVVPAHLSELSPDSVRSFFPGFVYQTGGAIYLALRRWTVF
jgi:hypothetical protein